MYSAKTVIELGWQPPAVVWSSKANAIKVAHKLQASKARFALLPFVLEARLSNLRAAHRRYLRRVGLPLTPVANKYRAKGRK